MFKRTKNETPVQTVTVLEPTPRHRADQIDYSTWPRETFEVPVSALHEARAIIRDEGALVVSSVTIRDHVVLTVARPA